MRPEGRAERLLRRLESDVTRAVGSPGAATLAFSGGLGSLVMAAVARKRCELVCVVAGTSGSPDVQAADLADKYLDYSLETVVLAPRDIVRIARRIHQLLLSESTRTVLSLVPLWAVRDQQGAGVLLTGHGIAGSLPIPSRLASKEGLGRVRPLGSGPTFEERAVWLDVARLLGLPRDLLPSRHRGPAEGAGVHDAIRREALRQDTAVSKLMDASSPVDCRRSPPRRQSTPHSHA